MAGRILVTGGAGFVGSNLVDNLLGDDLKVTVLDAFARNGAQHNIAWLRQRHPDAQLQVIEGDIRDFDMVKSVVHEVDIIYHLAAQVAVTTSVQAPHADFEINALGTLNVLEAARQSGCQPIVIMTSTNKVYGRMEDVPVVEYASRYEYRSLPYGVPETQPLDFHSPYGCSKGVADQYVRDYARIYDLPTVVFRMSCIYGPRQFGTEDQGWLAHFMISEATEKPITIYGNGKQVRDVLFVEDLVRAFRKAAQRIDRVAGEIFNIGGGPSNTLSVWSEFGRYLAELKGDAPNVSFDAWRPGDQPCYISDIRKARNLLDWEPHVDKETGIARLWDWVCSEFGRFDYTPREQRFAVNDQ